jgi:hypothetical protein
VAIDLSHGEANYEPAVAQQNQYISKSMQICCLGTLVIHNSCIYLGPGAQIRTV